jgi:hypothetical protein
MEENKNNSTLTSKAIRFLIYIVIGFAIAFIYRQIKK